MHLACGSWTACLKQKLEIFVQFYETLYISFHPSQVDIATFLEGLEIPKLSEEQREALDSPIQENEVLQAIGKLKNNKSPGFDGFTAKFYKKF